MKIKADGEHCKSIETQTYTKEDSEDKEKTIEEQERRLNSMKGDNGQLRKDIQTLIDFKNELEVLAEDQDKQILNLNNTLERFTEELNMKDSRIMYLENDQREKDVEILELNKDVKHLMDERIMMKK